MKYKEILQLSEDDRLMKEQELKKELMKLYAQIATGAAPENSGRIAQIRKILAKIQTSRKQK
ncbi:50S ribosomal protein L29 [Candidatus Woesearchaeota archaeon]|nr:50S ribosomal protein L29 [Candidatus Woesearchaeota archaeon]MBW3018213.1 50S ribosomal protein L29 [Candidatus Woesearchaeota archaeon]